MEVALFFKNCEHYLYTMQNIQKIGKYKEGKKSPQIPAPDLISDDTIWVCTLPEPYLCREIATERGHVTPRGAHPSSLFHTSMGVCGLFLGIRSLVCCGEVWVGNSIRLCVMPCVKSKEMCSCCLIDSPRKLGFWWRMTTAFLTVCRPGVWVRGLWRGA